MCSALTISELARPGWPTLPGSKSWQGVVRVWRLTSAGCRQWESKASFLLVSCSFPFFLRGRAEPGVTDRSGCCLFGWLPQQAHCVCATTQAHQAALLLRNQYASSCCCQQMPCCGFACRHLPWGWLLWHCSWQCNALRHVTKGALWVELVRLLFPIHT